MTIWIIIYWDFSKEILEEPTVTVFDNEEAAKKCYEYFKKFYLTCTLEKTTLYKSFEVTP